METASTDRNIRRRPEQATRYSGNKERQATQRTARPAADGFLKYAFAPMYTPAADLIPQKRTERDFYRSLSSLQHHYGLQVADHRELPYPYNILRSKHELERKLRRFGRNRELYIRQTEATKIVLTVCEQFRQHYDLYYIPVIPLYRMWLSAEQQQTAELLTTVFAYLYVEAGIGYYRDEDTFMHYNYEILEDWVDEKEGEEQEYHIVQKRCLDEAKAAGDHLQEKMMNREFRQNTERIIEAFTPQTLFQQQALKIARDAWAMWQEFSDTDLFKHISMIEEDEEDHDCNTTICMHEYVGFIASNRDALSDDLYMMVENDFNERTNFQQPEILTNFEGKRTKYKDELAYSERVFKLIDELAYLLNQQP
jgi:hypothetical protein